MASVPDPSSPGDILQPDGGSITQPDGGSSYIGNVMDAYNNGYTYDNLVDHHMENGIPTAPPQPSLDAIMSGNPITADDLQQPGRDAINEGAGPIGEAILAGSAGLGASLVKGAAEGIAGGVLSDISGTADSTAIKYGAAIGAGGIALGVDGLMNDPNQWGNDFKSQQEMVFRGMAEEQNRALAARRNNGR